MISGVCMIKRFLYSIIFTAFLFKVFASGDEFVPRESSTDSRRRQREPDHYLDDLQSIMMRSTRGNLEIKAKDLLDLENKKTVISIVDIGRIFLQFAKDSKDQSMGKMKLHKLCYYAQGYFLAFKGMPLCGEGIVAEKHGPFVPELTGIYSECDVDSRFSGSLIKGENVNLSNYPSEIVEYLRHVYEMKKKFTGVQLRYQTHEENPWVNNYKGSRVGISQSELKEFFSTPAPIAAFLEINLSIPSEKSIQEYFESQKRLLKQIHQVQKIVGFNDHFLPQVTQCKDYLPGLVSKIDDLIDTDSADLSRQMVGYLFFPSELVEDHTPLPSLFLNVALHWKLAHAARYGHPLGQFYFSKLLKHFEVHEEKSDQFLRMANSQFEKISSDDKAHPYMRGLAFKYLDKEQEAIEQFTIGSNDNHVFSIYELAKILERKGDDLAFETYSRISHDYPLANLRKGYYEKKNDERFNSFKFAGESGVAEGYYQIGRMIEEGFIVPQNENSKDATSWFVTAAVAGSSDALLKLAQNSEAENNDTEALQYYENLSSGMGNLRGYLEQGRIFENRALFQQAKEFYQKANWLGLYEIARMESDIKSPDAAETVYKIDACNIHFTQLLKIADGVDGEEDDE